MPLRGRKRKAIQNREQAEESIKPVKPDPDDSEHRDQVVGKLEKVHRKSSGADGIFAAGRFHDLGLAPALGDHIHGP